MHKNTAETIFNRLDDRGKTWKVYISEPMRFSGDGLTHFPRLKDQFATHFVPFAEFEADAANGDLPDFSFIEPHLGVGHNDYHPVVRAGPGARHHGRLGRWTRRPQSWAARRSCHGSTTRTGAMKSRTGVQRLEHGPFDRLGRTRRHLRPRAVLPRCRRWDLSAPAGQHGFRFDRSGYRVPAIIVSPWVAEGEVFNQEHRHTCLIATLREQWGLGDPFTARDAAARTFSYVFTLDTPRDPATWPVPDPRPVPQYIEDAAALGTSVYAAARTGSADDRGRRDRYRPPMLVASADGDHTRATSNRAAR